MILHDTSSPSQVKRLPPGRRLAPGQYVRPDGLRVEVVRELQSCDAYHVINHLGEHRNLPGAWARANLKRLVYPYKPPLRQQPAPAPDDPRGSMTVVAGVVALIVVCLLGLAVWVCAHLPRVELR